MDRQDKNCHFAQPKTETGFEFGYQNYISTDFQKEMRMLPWHQGLCSLRNKTPAKIMRDSCLTKNH